MIWWTLGLTATVLIAVFGKRKNRFEILVMGLLSTAVLGLVINSFISLGNTQKDLHSYQIMDKMASESVNDKPSITFTTEDGKKWVLAKGDFDTRVGSASVLEVRKTVQFNHWITVFTTKEETEYTIVVPGPGL